MADPTDQTVLNHDQTEIDNRYRVQQDGARVAYFDGQRCPTPVQGVNPTVTIKLVVAVTDGNWYQLLRQRQDLDEVNFWSPSPTNFKALTEGELFLFKLHAPNNFIVGGGIFTHANISPCSVAWEAFGEANGARSLEDMRSHIAHYLPPDSHDRGDFEIGCRVLAYPFFFDQSDWIPVPTNWSPNIVSFKTYDATKSEGLELWKKVHDLLGRRQLPAKEKVRERFGKPILIEPRLGQGAFRLLVTDIYERRCAVTREKTLPALEAAHIRPYRVGGEHEARNGLLLRRDIHSLFDAGLVTVTPDFRFEVSPQIKEEFGNGRVYYDLDGQSINIPSTNSHRPDREALIWHNENCFRG